MTILNLLFYVDLEISSKMKLICVPTHYYWSIPFSAVNSVFFLFLNFFNMYARFMLFLHISTLDLYLIYICFYIGDIYIYPDLKEYS